MKTKINAVLAKLCAGLMFAGCSGVETVELQPRARFVYVVDSMQVQFINKSEHATQYYWQFGDGSAASEMSPLKDYSSSGAGTYIVTLTVLNETKRDMSTDTIRLK